MSERLATPCVVTPLGLTFMVRHNGIQYRIRITPGASIISTIALNGAVSPCNDAPIEVLSAKHTLELLWDATKRAAL